MRLLAAVLLFALSACAAGAPAPSVGSTAPTASGLIGEYRLVHINGTPLPTASPSEVGVTVEGGAISLQADSSYVLRLDGRRSAQAEPASQTLRGTWRAAGAALALTPAQGGGALSFPYRLDGTRLRLTDPGGNEYAFERR